MISLSFVGWISTFDRVFIHAFFPNKSPFFGPLPIVCAFLEAESHRQPPKPISFTVKSSVPVRNFPSRLPLPRSYSLPKPTVEMAVFALQLSETAMQPAPNTGSKAESHQIVQCFVFAPSRNFRAETPSGILRVKRKVRKYSEGHYHYKRSENHDPSKYEKRNAQSGEKRITHFAIGMEAASE
jgi:hypothetical protein